MAIANVLDKPLYFKADLVGAGQSGVEFFTTGGINAITGIDSANQLSKTSQFEAFYVSISYLNKDGTPINPTSITEIAQVQRYGYLVLNFNSSDLQWNTSNSVLTRPPLNLTNVNNYDASAALFGKYKLNKSIIFPGGQTINPFQRFDVAPTITNLMAELVFYGILTRDISVKS